MTTISPHGLQSLGSYASHRGADGRVPARVRASARVADWNAIRAAMGLELLLLMAVIAALAGAVLST